MLEKLEVLKKGLDRGNAKGVFTLEESSLLLTNYVQLKAYLESEQETKTSEEGPLVEEKPSKQKK